MLTGAFIEGYWAGEAGPTQKHFQGLEKAPLALGIAGSVHLAQRGGGTGFDFDGLEQLMQLALVELLQMLFQGAEGQGRHAVLQARQGLADRLG